MRSFSQTRVTTPSLAPMRLMLKAHGSKRLQLKFKKLLSDFAFNVNLRRYIVVNNKNVSSPHSVRNGDKLRIIVCTPRVFGFEAGRSISLPITF